MTTITSAELEILSTKAIAAKATAYCEFSRGHERNASSSVLNE